MTQPFQNNGQRPFVSSSFRSTVGNNFDTVVVSGFSNFIRPGQVADFFNLKEGHCVCVSTNDNPPNVVLRFSSPVVAQNVVLRYNNANVYGQKLKIIPANIWQRDMPRNSTNFPQIPPLMKNSVPMATHNLQARKPQQAPLLADVRPMVGRSILNLARALLLETQQNIVRNSTSSQRQKQQPSGQQRKLAPNQRSPTPDQQRNTDRKTTCTPGRPGIMQHNAEKSGPHHDQNNEMNPLARKQTEQKKSGADKCPNEKSFDPNKETKGAIITRRKKLGGRHGKDSIQRRDTARGIHGAASTESIAEKSRPTEKRKDRNGQTPLEGKTQECDGKKECLTTMDDKKFDEKRSNTRVEKPSDGIDKNIIGEGNKKTVSKSSGAETPAPTDATKSRSGEVENGKSLQGFEIIKNDPKNKSDDKGKGKEDHKATPNDSSIEIGSCTDSVKNVNEDTKRQESSQNVGSTKECLGSASNNKDFGEGSRNCSKINNTNSSSNNNNISNNDNRNNNKNDENKAETHSSNNNQSNEKKSSSSSDAERHRYHKFTRNDGKSDHGRTTRDSSRDKIRHRRRLSEIPNKSRAISPVRTRRDSRNLGDGMTTVSGRSPNGNPRKDGSPGKKDSTENRVQNSKSSRSLNEKRVKDCSSGSRESKSLGNRRNSDSNRSESRNSKDSCPRSRKSKNSGDRMNFGLNRHPGYNIDGTRKRSLGTTSLENVPLIKRRCRRDKNTGSSDKMNPERLADNKDLRVVLSGKKIGKSKAAAVKEKDSIADDSQKRSNDNNPKKESNAKDCVAVKKPEEKDCDIKQALGSNDEKSIDCTLPLASSVFKTWDAKKESSTNMEDKASTVEKTCPESNNRNSDDGTGPEKIPVAVDTVNNSDTLIDSSKNSEEKLNYINQKSGDDVNLSQEGEMLKNSDMLKDFSPGTNQESKSSNENEPVSNKVIVEDNKGRQVGDPLKNLDTLKGSLSGRNLVDSELNSTKICAAVKNNKRDDGLGIGKEKRIEFTLKISRTLGDSLSKYNEEKMNDNDDGKDKSTRSVLGADSVVDENQKSVELETKESDQVESEKFHQEGNETGSLSVSVFTAASASNTDSNADNNQVENGKKHEWHSLPIPKEPAIETLENDCAKKVLVRKDQAETKSENIASKATTLNNQKVAGFTKNKAILAKLKSLRTNANKALRNLCEANKASSGAKTASIETKSSGKGQRDENASERLLTTGDDNVSECKSKVEQRVGKSVDDQVSIVSSFMACEKNTSDQKSVADLSHNKRVPAATAAISGLIKDSLNARHQSTDEGHLEFKCSLDTKADEKVSRVSSQNYIGCTNSQILPEKVRATPSISSSSGPENSSVDAVKDVKTKEVIIKGSETSKHPSDLKQDGVHNRHERDQIQTPAESKATTVSQKLLDINIKQDNNGINSAKTVDSAVAMSSVVSTKKHADCEQYSSRQAQTSAGPNISASSQESLNSNSQKDKSTANVENANQPKDAPRSTIPNSKYSQDNRPHTKEENQQKTSVELTTVINIPSENQTRVDKQGSGPRKKENELQTSIQQMNASYRLAEKKDNLKNASDRSVSSDIQKNCISSNSSSDFSQERCLRETKDNQPQTSAGHATVSGNITRPIGNRAGLNNMDISIADSLSADTKPANSEHFSQQFASKCESDDHTAMMVKEEGKICKLDEALALGLAESKGISAIVKSNSSSTSDLQNSKKYNVEQSKDTSSTAKNNVSEFKQVNQLLNDGALAMGNSFNLTENNVPENTEEKGLNSSKDSRFDLTSSAFAKTQEKPLCDSSPTCDSSNTNKSDHLMPENLSLTKNPFSRLGVGQVERLVSGKADAKDNLEVKGSSPENVVSGATTSSSFHQLEKSTLESSIKRFSDCERTNMLNTDELLKKLRKNDEELSSEAISMNCDLQKTEGSRNLNLIDSTVTHSVSTHGCALSSDNSSLNDKLKDVKTVNVESTKLEESDTLDVSRKCHNVVGGVQRALLNSGLIERKPIPILSAPVKFPGAQIQINALGMWQRNFSQLAAINPRYNSFGNYMNSLPNPAARLQLLAQNIARFRMANAQRVTPNNPSKKKKKKARRKESKYQRKKRLRSMQNQQSAQQGKSFNAQRGKGGNVNNNISSAQDSKGNCQGMKNGENLVQSGKALGNNTSAQCSQVNYQRTNSGGNFVQSGNSLGNTGKGQKFNQSNQSVLKESFTSQDFNYDDYSVHFQIGEDFSQDNGKLSEGPLCGLEGKNVGEYSFQNAKGFTQEDNKQPTLTHLMQSSRENLTEACQHSCHRNDSGDCVVQNETKLNQNDRERAIEDASKNLNDALKQADQSHGENTVQSGKSSFHYENGHVSNNQRPPHDVLKRPFQMDSACFNGVDSVQIGSQGVSCGSLTQDTAFVGKRKREDETEVSGNKHQKCDSQVENNCMNEVQNNHGSSQILGDQNVKMSYQQRQFHEQQRWGVRKKLKSINQRYNSDSVALLKSVKILARADPSLTEKLKGVLKESLAEIGQKLIGELHELKKKNDKRWEQFVMAKGNVTVQNYPKNKQKSGKNVAQNQPTKKPKGASNMPQNKLQKQANIGKNNVAQSKPKNPRQKGVIVNKSNKGIAHANQSRPKSTEKRSS